MEYESDSDQENIPDEIEEAAAAATHQLLLSRKSKNRYDQMFVAFEKWMSKKNCKTVNEDIILAYLFEKSKILKSSSLWSHYSMIKSSLLAHKNVDISKFQKVITFLKRQSVGYKPKKSKVLCKEEINKFIAEASDYDYLMMKVALIMGLAGACRREDMTNMSLTDIEDTTSILMVNIPNTKKNIERKFVIVGEKNVELYRKYLSLRPKNTPHNRFFVYYKQGKCTIQPVGINTFGNIPCKIAKFLQLPNPREYTGHCLRRSSATLLVESFGSISERCKIQNEIDNITCNSLSNTTNSNSLVLKLPHNITFTNCQNVTINFIK